MNGNPTGKLSLTKKGAVMVEYTNKNGKSVTAAVPQDQLSKPLAQLRDAKSANLNGVQVEFEIEEGQPRNVREMGKSFEKPVASRDARSGQSRSGDRRQDGNQGQRRNHDDRPHAGRRPANNSRERTPIRRDGDFHNPYNFVPAPPRHGIQGELGDREPVGHHQCHPDHYTGTITVRATAKTPLLIPDTFKAKENEATGHKTYDVLTDSAGRPILPPTGFKGMLRSAFEAVTNSRLSVFSDHGDRLAFRMDARDGLALIPARIVGNQIHLLMGFTGAFPVPDNGRWKILENPDDAVSLMYAAWLPRYHHGHDSQNAPKYLDDSLPQHGDEVECWVELVEHENFDYCAVRRIVRRGTRLGAQPQRGRESRRHKPTGKFRQITGYVCVTNCNINRKHDERVFFDASPTPTMMPLTDELRSAWTELIRNYQTTHARELQQRERRDEAPNAYLGPEPGRTAWSRHVYTQADLRLNDGALCYAKMNVDNSAVAALYPVMIARDLFDVAPDSLIENELKPAPSRERLSPADRVFGWANQNGDGAYRGQLRVRSIKCRTTDAVARFDNPGLPLAILGEPKPQQARFYVAEDDSGSAQMDGLTTKEAGYETGKGLRGRKVYPHHAGLPAGHWDDPVTDRTQTSIDGHFQEYRRPDSEKLRDEQNRTILGWVKPNTEFVVTIDVVNLSAVELGALVWLLSLPDGHVHRFGGGKPLGFGSIRLEVESAELRTGNELKDFYTSFSPTPAGNPSAHAIDAFKQAVIDEYGTGMEFPDVPFIAAFLQAARGFDDGKPVRYPRARQAGQRTGEPLPPHPEGLAYEWFVASQRGRKFALPDLHGDPGLPDLDAR